MKSQKEASTVGLVRNTVGQCLPKGSNNREDGDDSRMHMHCLITQHTNNRLINPTLYLA